MKKNFQRLMMPLLLLCLAAASVSAQTFTRKPFLQKGAPTKGSVCWRLSAAASLTARFGTDSTLTVYRTTAASTNATDACVLMDSLTPATRYFYELYSGTTKIAGSAKQAFKTHPVLGTRGKYNFWLLGDAGTGSTTQAKVRDAFAQFNGTNKVDGIIMLGDNAYSTGTDAEHTSNLFNVYSDAMAVNFTWPTQGNHEAMSTGSAPYLAAFYLPTAGESGGVPSGSELYYSFDIGNIHFICMDSQTAAARTTTGAQYLWLQQDLQATQQDWIIAFFHHPPYTWGSHNSDTESDLVQVRQNLIPLLEQYGVDFVYTGHSHNYERSFLIDSAYGNNADNGTKKAQIIKDNTSGNPATTGPYHKTKGPHKGAVYTVAGSSGQTGSTIGLLNVKYVQHRIMGSVLLTVEDSVATAKFVDSGGTVRDQVQIVKSRGTVTGVGKVNPRSASKFAWSGRRFQFPADNALSFRVYALDGNVRVNTVPRGNWLASPEELPTGEYYYRYGTAYGRISLP